MSAIFKILPKLPKGLTRAKWLMKEYPDIATCFAFYGIGFVGLVIGSKVYDKDTYHQHKYRYTVIREEDADPVVKEKCCYN